MKCGVVRLPLVSVVIPAYNAAAFIGQTLASALNQTYRNLEVIIADDGSNDETPQIIDSFAKRDNRLIVVRQRNRGVAAARNLAIETCRGEYIAPLDADDIWYPQKIEKQVNCFLESGPFVGLVYAWLVQIDSEGALIGIGNQHDVEGFVYNALAFENFVGGGSMPLIRRTCLEAVGNYNTYLRAQQAEGAEDWELYLRIAEHYEFRVVPDYLLKYRSTVNSMSKNYESMLNAHCIIMKDIEEKHPEIPPQIRQWSKSNIYIKQFIFNYKIGKYLRAIELVVKIIYLDPKEILSFLLMNPRMLLQTRFCAEMTVIPNKKMSWRMLLRQRLLMKKRRWIKENTIRYNTTSMYIDEANEKQLG